MRLWRFADPGDYRFAQASRRGAWSQGAGLCPECSASHQKRVQPLILEWEPSADVVGDFTWLGFGSDMAVSERVAEAVKFFGGFELGPVEMVQGSESRPDGGANRAKPRVLLPYRGPRLHELWISGNVHLDPEKSSVRLIKECRTCGQKHYEADGIERWKLLWDAVRREVVKAQIHRIQGKGIFVSGRDLDGMAIFRVVEFPSWALCTDRVKEAITQNGFSNVDFLEIGETF